MSQVFSRGISKRVEESSRLPGERDVETYFTSLHQAFVDECQAGIDSKDEVSVYTLLRPGREVSS